MARVEIPGGGLSRVDIYIPSTYPPVNPWPAIRAVGLPAASRLISSPLARCPRVACAARGLLAVRELRALGGR